MRKSIWLGIVALVVVLGVGTYQARLKACAVAPHAKDFVSIKDEDALIVWDAENRTEHFLRRARFQHLGDGTGFGFLVPTPTQPTLTEADPALFDALGSLTVAPIERIIHYRPRPAKPPFRLRDLVDFDENKSVGAASPAPNAMAVLEEKSIAGYDAAVLKATDLDALTDWLKEHDYDYTPEMKEWLGEYVKKEWIITAFKVSVNSDRGSAALGLVRISFQTDTPFYPYREPKPNPNDPQASVHNPRRLRLFVMAPQRMDGTLGMEGPAWPGDAKWADQLLVAQQKVVNEKLKVESLDKPGIWWLTEFQDDSSPRPGTDEVFLQKSVNATPLHRPPQRIEETIYVDSLSADAGVTMEPRVLFLVVALFLVGGGLAGFVGGMVVARRVRAAR